jgi:hypothetical protein
MTRVFVPQDLGYMQMTADELRLINPRLVPLIAHDRAGFGGGLCCGGLTMLWCAWHGATSRSLWQVLALAGGIGFTAAIAVHPAIGYTDAIHLAPACLGALLFAAGIMLCYRPMMRGETHQPEASARIPDA